MKKLKIGMFALLMVVGSMAWAQRGAGSASQQSSKTPEERATSHNQRLSEKLGLNADQQKSVYNFCLQRAQQEDADRAKYQSDRAAMKNARMQNEQTFENNLAGVLTPDQKTKYEQMKQEQKQKREGGKGGSQE